MGHGELGIGNWALGIGNWAWAWAVGAIHELPLHLTLRPFDYAQGTMTEAP